MLEVDVQVLVFSFLVMVYGDLYIVFIDELFLLVLINFYGCSKYMVELIMQDICVVFKCFSVIILCYFNFVGVYLSGLIGEDFNGILNNLMFFIVQVVCGKCEQLLVFGNDYLISDGIGVCDYIYVCDFVEGYVVVLE